MINEWSLLKFISWVLYLIPLLSHSFNRPLNSYFFSCFSLNKFSCFSLKLFSLFFISLTSVIFLLFIIGYSLWEFFLLKIYFLLFNLFSYKIIFPLSLFCFLLIIIFSPFNFVFSSWFIKSIYFWLFSISLLLFSVKHIFLSLILLYP